MLELPFLTLLALLILAQVHVLWILNAPSSTALNFLASKPPLDLLNLVEGLVALVTFTMGVRITQLVVVVPELFYRQN